MLKSGRSFFLKNESKSETTTRAFSYIIEVTLLRNNLI